MLYDPNVLAYLIKFKVHLEQYAKMDKYTLNAGSTFSSVD